MNATTKKRRLRVLPDIDPINPRTEYDNFCHMALFHGRYDLGDKDIPFNPSQFSGWLEMGRYIEKELDAICLPVFMYDHSGICLNTTGFSCPWDSRQVGFVYVTRKEIKEENDISRVSPKARENAIASMKAEVQGYSSYLEGDCYGYVVEELAEDGDETDSGDWEEVDSCWGFLGREWAKQAFEDLGFTKEEVQEAFSRVEY